MPLYYFSCSYFVSICPEQGKVFHLIKFCKGWLVIYKQEMTVILIQKWWPKIWGPFLFLPNFQACGYLEALLASLKSSMNWRNPDTEVSLVSWQSWRGKVRRTCAADEAACNILITLERVTQWERHVFLSGILFQGLTKNNSKINFWKTFTNDDHLNSAQHFSLSLMRIYLLAEAWKWNPLWKIEKVFYWTLRFQKWTRF